MKFHPTAEFTCNGRQEGKSKETKDGIKPKKLKEKIKKFMERMKNRKPNQFKDKFKNLFCHPSFPKAVANASNQFSVRMYNEMLREKSPRDGFLLGLFRSSGNSPKNVVMSAFSVYTVLGMLRVGAGPLGETRKQLTETLSLPGLRVAKCRQYCQYIRIKSGYFRYFKLEKPSKKNGRKGDNVRFRVSEHFPFWSNCSPWWLKLEINPRRAKKTGVDPLLHVWAISPLFTIFFNRDSIS